MKSLTNSLVEGMSRIEGSAAGPTDKIDSDTDFCNSVSERRKPNESEYVSEEEEPGSDSDADNCDVMSNPDLDESNRSRA